jgi:drug/metabolite transporter (DMT)-like permease
VELMLLTTVLLWALNLSVTKYILTHGFGPLPYATVRYGLAALIFVSLTFVAERTLRIERRHLPIVALAAVVLWLNQLSFVFALDLATASTIGLLLGAIPIFTAIFGLILGTERPLRRSPRSASDSSRWAREARSRPRGSGSCSASRPERPGRCTRLRSRR